MIHNNMNITEKARQYATIAHQGQFRNYTKQPYISHPERVANEVRKAGYSDTMVSAAYLHDVIEDCGKTYANIAVEFGTEIATLVDELTNKSKDSKENRATRKQMDRERLKNVSREAKIIKLIDRLDNLGEMSGAQAGFIHKYSDESLELVKVIGDAEPVLAGRIVEMCNNYKKLV